MPASNKLLRQNPQQDITKYNLYYVVDNDIGLSQIHNRQMTVCSGSSGEPGYQLTATTSVENMTILDIGFDFVFNNTTFKQIHISSFGWLTLDYPDEAWDFSDFFSGNSIYYGNENIEIRSSMTTNHVMVCPWFEFLRNFCNRKNDEDPDGSGTDVTSTTVGMSFQNSEYSKYGILSASNFIQRYNPELTGVRYYRENNLSLGRQLIIRWNSLTKFNSIAFECILFENGRIEFRYCPLQNIQNTTDTFYYSLATIGIFGSKTKNIFRDFACELRPRQGLLSGSYTWNYGGGGEMTTLLTTGTIYNQLRYNRGGAIYDENFRDVVTTNMATWAGERPSVSSLSCQTDWPGKLFKGGMFIFQPQTLKRKILPRKQLKNINTNNIKHLSSLFDDRKTIQNITTQVNFPTKLQRDFAGNTLKTQLFHDFFEGGIETTGSNVNMYDVYQNTQEVENFIQQNTSYNENSVDFNISNNLDYFSSGTNVNISPGFEQQLTSKDKIVIELPLNYSTNLLSTASSMYYYSNITKSLVLCNRDSSALTENRALSDINRYAQPEDYIGFSACGTLITSGSYIGTLKNGSYNINSQSQSNQYINTSLTEQSYKNAIQTTYNNSVCINQSYNATDDQTFTLPITKPFLIEKAIIEVQIEAAYDWSTDYTRYQQPFAPDNQIISGTQFIDISGPAVTCALFHQYNNSNLQYRNLILSSTFSTISDNTSSYTILSSNQRLQLITFGLHAANCHATYVTPNSDWDGQNAYTTFTGSIKMFTKPQTSSGCIATVRTIAYTSSSATNHTLLSSTLSNPFINLNNVSTIPNTSGTTVNLHSITNFGRSQTGFIDSGQSIFGKELLSNVKIQNFQNIFAGASQTENFWIDLSDKFITTFPVSLMKFIDNPYLIFPNQKLVFAVSKARAALRATTNDDYYDQRSHDIKFVSGSNIKITLYGSYVKENKEYHSVQNTLQENDIYDVIDNEPILDQFDVFSRKSHYNSYNDLFMTGSLLINGERKKAFSFSTASQTNNFDQSQNYSYTLTKQFELSGINTYIRIPSMNEIYFDSCIPDIRQIVKLNTSKTFGAYSNEMLARWKLSVSGSNDDWMWSFPFEPRYSLIERLRTFPREYNIYDLSTDLPLSKKTRSIILEYGNYETAIDVDAINFTSLSNIDLAKGIFGFGDHNSYDGIYGANHLPTLLNGIVGHYYHPTIRGWKYGLYNALPIYTSCVFRKNHYGFVRDMLEQRHLTTFYTTGVGGTLLRGPVTVQFINPLTNKTTKPESTWSSNVDYHCTSSLPFFDGISKNRSEINVNNMNLTLNSLSFNDTNVIVQ